MPKPCIILTTIDNMELANSIINELLLKKLASCVTIDEVKSFFIWDNKLECRLEFRLEIKTKDEDYQKIENVILNKHNDNVPQIIQLEITRGLKTYLEWIIEDN